MSTEHQQGFSLGGWFSDTCDVSQKDMSLTIGSDPYWMAQALRLSMLQVGKPSPNPTVGCIFVKNNQLLAQGATLEFGGLHAERKAIADCPDPKLLQGSDCYVTLEPCAHQGKQPPCVEALVQLGIRRCIVALRDPFPVVNGRGIEFLRRHGIEVELGVLARECAAWHFPFLLATKRQKPVLIGKWAQTLDGHLADDWGQSKWISGTAARQHTHWLRQKYDAIAVGGPTAMLDQPSLDVRDCKGPINRHPTKLVYDPKARLLDASPEQCQKLADNLLVGAKVFWGVDEDLWKNLNPDQRRQADRLLEHEQLKMLKLTAGELSFSAFITKASSEYPKHHNGRGLQSVLIEGGPSLLSHLIHLKQLDAAHVFINPSFVGGQKHRLGPLREISGELASAGKPINQRIQFIPFHLQALGTDLLWDLVEPTAYDLVWGRL